MEAKCLSAINDLKRKNWHFNGYYIWKAARTYMHPNRKIRRLDSRKVDLVVVFKNDNDKSAAPLIFVLQVKSTPKAYKKFINHRNYQNIKCILIRPAETPKEVIKNLDWLFKELLALGQKNKFLRPKIKIDLL